MINFEALRKARERMDDSLDGQFGRCGNWKIALGGYDHGYEVYYKEEPVMRVNYELDEYEFYSCDYSNAMFTQDTIPQIKKALEITPRFDNVGDIDDNGDYIDHFGQYVNGVEADVSESGKSKRVKIVKESEDPELKQAYEDIESMWDGQLDWVDDKEFTFALANYTPGDDIGEITDWMDSLAKEYGLKVDSTHDGHYVFWKEDIVSEERLPVMWAIDFRDMHSGIHGLYYGKDRSDVEKFYDRLKVIYADDDISPEEQEMCYQELWDEFYPRIKEIDEINFRDIGKLPSGKYGIIIDDVEYRLVNVMNCLDIYAESKKVVKESYDDEWASVGAAFNEFIQRLWSYTRKDRDNRIESFQECRKACEEAMKDYYDMVVIDESTKKPVEESTADNDGEPRIYVGTYAKYNNGSLDGKWVDLMQFDTYEEFVDYCRELHKDEKDPEFMVQDFENYPKAWYHEGGLPTEEEFDKITNFYMMDGDRKAAYEAYVNHTGDDDLEHFQEAYQGKFNSAEDFAYDLVDGIGWDGVGENNLEMYFDYDSFGRDLMYDFHRGDEDNEDAEGNPEDPDKYYDNEGYEMGEYESDDQVARDYIDNLGGVAQLGQETAQRYFDYEAFGRDLLINDYFEEDGYVFLRI